MAQYISKIGWSDDAARSGRVSRYGRPSSEGEGASKKATEAVMTLEYIAYLKTRKVALRGTVLPLLRHRTT